jgi:hypothetical protein
MGHLGDLMKKIWLSNNAHTYLKEKARNDKKTLIETADFIIEVFKQVNAQITLQRPKQGYLTCQKAFYEQNKCLLEPHQREFFESNKENMNLYFQKNKEKFQIFKIAYMKQQRESRKERLKQYNCEYYFKRKNG